MAKKGMARPDRTKKSPKNEQPPVPELQGKAKHSHHRASIPAGDGPSGPQQMVFPAPNPQPEKRSR